MKVTTKWVSPWTIGIVGEGNSESMCSSVFLFPIVVEVEIEFDEPIILSIEFPIPLSSPNSECNDEGGEVEEAGGG